MLAYVYDKNGKLSLKEKPKPESRDENAIIKVNACSICGTDLRTYLHGSTKIIPPRVIGHEVCGTLSSVGQKIGGFYIGERVIVVPAVGCGKCYFCSRGYTNLCDNLKTIGFQYDGGFAEYMEIPLIAFMRGNVIKIGELVVDEEAALVEPIACVFNAQEFLKIRECDCVAIFGCGFIGCMHAELALLGGSKQVIMIDTIRRRAEKAKKLITGIKIIYPYVDLLEEIKKLTKGRGVDVAITACSSGQAQMDALSITAKRGRVSLFGGLPSKSTGFIDSNIVHYKELSIYGVHASTLIQNRIILDWITTGKLNLKKYTSETFSLQNIKEAFKSIQNGNIIKAIIRPNK